MQATFRRSTTVKKIGESYRKRILPKGGSYISYDLRGISYDLRGLREWKDAITHIVFRQDWSAIPLVFICLERQ